MKKKKITDKKCLICGEKINNKDSMHSCRKLKEELDEDIDVEKTRTYGEKMEEFDKYFNPDKYFDIP